MNINPEGVDDQCLEDVGDRAARKLLGAGELQVDCLGQGLPAAVEFSCFQELARVGTELIQKDAHSLMLCYVLPS